MGVVFRQRVRAQWYPTRTEPRYQIMNGVARYLLPGLIIAFCLPSAAMGTLAVVSNLVQAGALHVPLAILLYTCSLIIGLSRGPVLVGAAGALWLWLVVGGDRTSTKVWTAAIIIAAIYGLHVFHREFQMR
jgi:hypothetical protein